MHRLKHYPFVLFIISLLMVISVFILEKNATNSPLGIHETADDASYLRPAENWINNGIWKDNSIGASSYVQRPPLFSAFHLIFYLVSKKNAPFLMFLFSLGLHLVAVQLIYRILKVEIPNKTAFTATCIYAIIPLFYGFLSYQITESLSGSLMIIGIYLFTKRQHAFVYASVYLIGLALFRPILLLAFLPPFILLIKNNFLKNTLNWKQLTLIGFCGSILILWEIRKQHYTQEWFNPHPIYHESNESQYRPIHEKFSNLFRVWETKPEVFHSIMGKAWSNEPFNRNEIYRYCTKRSIPLEKEKLLNLLERYQAINIEVQHNFKGSKVIKQTANEIALGKELVTITEKLIHTHPIRYWFQTPLQGMKEQLFKSHLNLTIFQETYRGTIGVEFLRIISLAIVLFIYFSIPMLIFIDRKWKMFALGALIYLFYLFCQLFDGLS